ncbi:MULTISPECIES: nucleoside/nucleotide kinase family protein [unclassified Falsihalocynthiibacter]|uniref:nucleoside/nucleotide kinase family protein n=1 Tax=unclassified Falsihalocynthiibacter TaxID=2854191 RepID=UPI0035100CA6
MRDLDAICTTLLAAPRKGRRRLVALAGAPASGKSTLAQDLADRMTAAGCDTRVLPMDGFHLGNTQLHAQGNFAQKGAPQTFDVRGFLMLVARIQTEDEVFYPIFDRTLDAAIAAEGRVDKACDTVIVEGNYLLFDAQDWRDLVAFWDISLRLKVSRDILQQRLLERWLGQGLSPAAALIRAQGNDLVNADLIAKLPLKADILLD